jgi:predicted ATPase with chaperone activity
MRPVKKSGDRAGISLTNSGFKLPMGRSTINPAPADVKKEGPSFDLPTSHSGGRKIESIQTTAKKRQKPGAARRNRIRNCPYQMDEGSRRKD